MKMCLGSLGSLVKVLTVVAVMTLGVKGVLYRDIDYYQFECDSLCSVFADRYGYPNYGYIQSVQNDFNIGQGETNSNMLTTHMSTVNHPAILMAYYHYVADFDLQVSLLDLVQGMATDPDYQLLASGVELSGSAFAYGFYFPRIIEFEDTNNDGVFSEADGDVVLQEYLFSDHPFEKMIAEKTPIDGDLETVTFNATTQDGVFTISLATSTIFSEDLPLLGPDTSKIDITIRDFPYVGTGSKLALHSMLLSSVAAADFEDFFPDSSVTAEATIMFQNYASYTWQVEVEITNSSISDTTTTSTVSYENGFTDESAIPIDSREPYELSVGLSWADSFATGAFRSTYYVFDAQNAQLIYWDPALNFLEAPPTEEETDNAAGSIKMHLVSVLSLIFIVLLSVLL